MIYVAGVVLIDIYIYTLSLKPNANECKKQETRNGKQNGLTHVYAFPSVSAANSQQSIVETDNILEIMKPCDFNSNIDWRSSLSCVSSGGK